MKGVFLALVVAVVLLTTCVVSSGGQEDLQTILTALAQSPGLTNVNITARETRVVYINPASKLLPSNAQLDKKLIEEVKNSVKEQWGTVTNSRTCTYKFRKEGFLSSASGLDPRTKLIEEKTLVLHKEMFKLSTFIGHSDGTNRSHIGEISLRLGKEIPGVPVFLTKSILGSWVRTAQALDYTVAVSSKGVQCGVIKVTPPAGVPVTYYEVLFGLDNSTPVEFRSYSPDGKLSSLSQLEVFEGVPYALCTQWTTKRFSGDEVASESSWEIISIEKDDSPLNERDTFFPEGTPVTDRRSRKRDHIFAGCPSAQRRRGESNVGEPPGRS